MKLLILGGSGWLGHAIAELAVRGGHQVTCVVRRTAVPAGVRLVRADRDQDDALPGVAASPWDAVIDLARQPGHVRRAVRDLRRVAGRYLFVSTCSVYASQAEIGADEDAALLPPLAADVASPEEYGSAKVACEDAVLQAFGDQRSVIVRPGLIGGPGDPSGRSGYWALRFAKPSNPEGRVLVPDTPELPTAIIDARDLASWIVRLAEGTAAGVFDAVGESVLFPDHLAVARSVAGHSGPVVRAPEDWLLERGVAEWSGPRSLPLWLADRDWYGMNSRPSARAKAAGLTLRPPADTLADSLAWDLDHVREPGSGAGLSDSEENALLSELQAANGLGRLGG